MNWENGMIDQMSLGCKNRDKCLTAAAHANIRALPCDGGIECNGEVPNLNNIKNKQRFRQGNPKALYVNQPNIIEKVRHYCLFGWSQSRIAKEMNVSQPTMNMLINTHLPEFRGMRLAVVNNK